MGEKPAAMTDAEASTTARERERGTRGAGAKGAGTASRTRSVAFVGLTIALMSVSAWVSVPLGPVPFTLQTFVMVFALLALAPKECLAAIAGYLILGGVGLPLFSSMRGGLGVLAGPTGGFLWGFLVGAALALALRHALSSLADRGGFAQVTADLAACVAFVVVSYACGCFQYMLVAGVDLPAAFAVAVAPFLIPDSVKLVAAVVCAHAVQRALPRR